MDLSRHNEKPETMSTKYQADDSECIGENRLCENGDCIPKADLCPEQEEMNENTIVIMVIIGGVVLIFLIVLYCFQQRTQSHNMNGNANPGTFESIVGDGDNASLNMPPPDYNEVISTDLYPPTPNMQRSTRISSSDEPITPPPNYDAALHILARSQENICSTKRDLPVIRRSVSSDINPSSPNSTSRALVIDFRRGISSSEERP